MQQDLNYPALLLKFKTRIEDALAQEFKERNRLTEQIKEYSSELNYIH